MVTPAVLSRSEAAAYVGLSVSTLESLVRAETFPRPRLLSPGRVGWIRTELDAWLAARPASDLLPPRSGRSRPGSAFPSSGRVRGEAQRVVRTMT